MSVWEKLKYFDRNEFDNPDRMDEYVLRTVDFIRHVAGEPFFVTSDYREGDGGLHGSGDALDWATPTSRSRNKYAYQEQMWTVVIAANDAKQMGFTNNRHVQMEIVQGPVDWHFHLGLYPTGSPLRSKLIPALD